MAAKDTPSMAKNKIKRSLLAILDPHPKHKEIAELWVYFNSSCAYCGTVIPRDSRSGHIDHLVSSALGGSNSIHNHVLSCARCNGDEKREEPWEPFVYRKATNSTLAAERHAHIAAWLSRGPSVVADPDLQVQADEIIARALDSFDSSVAELRMLRKSGA